MLNSAATLAMIWAMAFSAGEEPVAYETAVAAQAVTSETPEEADSSISSSDDELVDHLSADPDWRASARLYHAGGGGATGRDSLGCQPIAMRTVAVDPNLIPRRTRLFIRETVGLELADGTRHDGYWYASDTGGAIRGAKIDLYTGHGRASMRPVQGLNMKTLTITDAGDFDGCPPAWETASN